MVKNTEFLEKVHLQMYLYMLSELISNRININDFEDCFLQIRRTDNYWLNGKFSQIVENILNSFFLDLDEYSPDALYNSEDKFNITKEQLIEKAAITLEQLNRYIRQ